MSAAKWTLQDAKNKLSQVVRAANAGAPQIITRRGVATAVVISVEDFERLDNAEYLDAPSLIDLLLNFPKGEEPFERAPSRELRDIGF